MTVSEFVDTARILARPGLAFRTLPRDHPHRRTIRRYPDCTVICVRLDGTPEDLKAGAERCASSHV